MYSNDNRGYPPSVDQMFFKSGATSGENGSSTYGAGFNSKDGNDCFYKYLGFPDVNSNVAATVMADESAAVESTGVLWCPTAKSMIDFQTIRNGSFCVWNDYVTDWGYNVANPGVNIGAGGSGIPSPINLNHMSHSTESAWIFDAPLWSVNGANSEQYFNVNITATFPPPLCLHNANGLKPNGWNSTQRCYDGYENVLFFDGHVAAMRYDELKSYAFSPYNIQGDIFWHGWRVQ
jgi:hypothetical protein